MAIINAIVFFFVFEKKKKMTTFVTFFDGFVAKIGDNNYNSLFHWFCYKEGDGSNVVAFFYGGGAMKKAMVANCCHLFFLFFFFGPFGLIH